MKWFKNKLGNLVAQQVLADVAIQAVDVSNILLSMKMVKTASADRKDVHFYIDPKLAENYKINLHMISQSDSGSSGEDVITKAAGLDGKEFAEETISFPSKIKRDPNYICSIVFQKPEDEVYAVSAYLVETYLGRYAYKSNWYFRAGSTGAAKRCYARVLRAVKDLRTDIIEGTRNQNEVPYQLRRVLQGEAGEIEPKSNKMATYLNPDNVMPKSSANEADNIVYIPKNRSIKEDLELE